MLVNSLRTDTPQLCVHWTEVAQLQVCYLPVICGHLTLIIMWLLSSLVL